MNSFLHLPDSWTIRLEMVFRSGVSYFRAMHVISRDNPCYYSEKMLMEPVHYTHNNPVRAGLVERAEDYRWSSIRCWNGNPLEDEPLLMDLDRIKWRSR